jgi:Fur family ferric uptake transcriptional regulator
LGNRISVIPHRINKFALISKNDTITLFYLPRVKKVTEPSGHNHDAKKIAQMAIDRFQKHVRNEGMRWTQEREQLLQLIYKLHGHFSVEDLYGHAQDNGLNISKATIYRNVSLLEKCNLVDKITTHQGEVVYEHSLDHEHHDHLICTKCRKLIEFQNRDIERLQIEIAQEHQFQIKHHSLNIYGLCTNCQ